MTILQKQDDNRLVVWNGGLIKDSSGNVSRVSKASALNWFEGNHEYPNSWNLYKPKQVNIRPTILDRNTEIIDGSTIVTTETEITRTFTKRNKTAQELSDEKTDKAGNLSEVVLLALYNLDARVRKLEVRPAITVEKFKTTELENLFTS